MATAVEARPAARAGRRQATVGAAIGAAVVLWGVLIGLEPLGDNSFLTHLATGRYLLHHGVPRHDPFSFTAAGQRWVVQSWFASLAYGVADRFGGGTGLVLLHALLTGVLAAIVVRLARPATSLFTRVLVLAVALGVGTAMWVQRPLLIGLVVLAATLLVAEDGLDPRWLAPLYWVWANSHGSFPLGLALLVVLGVGRRLDGHRPTRELAALKWAGIGTVLAAVNPLGPSLLVFPVHLLERQAVLSHVIEWQSPKFVAPVERLFLLQLILFVVAVVRRPSWRRALPGLAFAALSLTAMRNIPLASLVMLPAMAEGLDGLGTLGVAKRARAAGALVVAMALVAVLGVVSVLGRPAFVWADYPVAQVSALAHDGAFDRSSSERIATEDFVGNYLTLRFGPIGRVFFDDRYDMYPTAMSADYLALLEGAPSWEAILDHRGVTTVLWERHRPLASLVAESPRWRVVSDDGKWLVAERR